MFFSFLVCKCSPEDISNHNWLCTSGGGAGIETLPYRPPGDSDWGRRRNFGQTASRIETWAQRPSSSPIYPYPARIPPWTPVWAAALAPGPLTLGLGEAGGQKVTTSQLALPFPPPHTLILWFLTLEHNEPNFRNTVGLNLRSEFLWDPGEA